MRTEAALFSLPQVGFDPLPQTYPEITERLTQSSERLNAVLERANVIAEGIDPEAVNGVVNNIADAAKTLDETVGQAKAILSGVDPQEIGLPLWCCDMLAGAYEVMCEREENGWET